MFYLEHTFGNPFLFRDAMAVWGRTSTATGIAVRANELLNAPDLATRLLLNGVDIGFMLLGGLLLLGVLRGERGSYRLYALYALGFPIASLQVSSMPRYLIVIFPLFVVVARWLSPPLLFRVALTGMAIMQAYFVARWCLGYWVA
jgi:hypothetical protein